MSADSFSSGQSEASHMPPEAVLNKVEKEVWGQVTHTVSSEIGERRDEVKDVLNTKSERIERLKTLRPRLLVINPEDPENSPDLIQIERLYTANLISPEAFLALEDDDHRTFTLASERGGMLNHFQPTPEELVHYPQGYESVKQQVIRDLIGGSDSPGDYRMVGLFDRQDILRASLSYRLPPKMISNSSDADEYCARRDAYCEYLQASLLNKEELPRQMKYEPRWDKKRLKNQFRDLWEIDTFNVENDWRGAGYLVLQSALDQILEERGEIPEAVFCYRFSGIRRNDPETHQQVLVGPNRGSRTFLENLGFHEMAHKALKDEVVIRTMPDGMCHQYHPEWLYLHNGRNRLQRQLNDCLVEMGLREGGSSDQIIQPS